MTVSKPDSGNTNTFNLGEFTFTGEGTYVFEVSEVKGLVDGLTYSTNKATITVVIGDDLNGGFISNMTIENDTFTNIYNYETVTGGLNFIKTLEG